MPYIWKIKESEIVFHSPWYTVQRETVEIAPGKVIDDYFMGVFSDIVMIVAITDDGMVPFTKQYKHGAQKVLMELPAGYMEKGEDPLACAKRELKEETGYTASDWKHISYYYRSSTKARGGNMHVFLAQGAQHIDNQALDDTEDIEVITMSLSDALQALYDGEFEAGDTMLSLLLANNFLKK